MANGGKKSEQNIVTDIQSAAISYDVEALDEFIHSQGVKLIHYAGMACPLGLTDPNDEHAIHAECNTCSNGFVFTKVGCATALMQQNGNNPSQSDLGLIEDSTKFATFARKYDDRDELISVAPFDRFYLDEPAIVVPTWERLAHNQSGVDRVKFPISSVQQLMDARGIVYKCGEDFTHEENRIIWKPGKGPGENFDVQIGGNDRGTVFSVRYFYRPFWYCARMVHEIRVSQVDTPEGRKIVKMPQAAILKREFVYQNEFKKEEDATSRQASSPPSGGFGSF